MSKVHFILDEAAMLGSMPAIDSALGIGRAYDVRLQLYYQSVGQLQRCFPDGAEQTLFSNTTQIFFGVNDNATADYVSTRLGDETIIVESGGTSRSSTRQYSYSSQSGDSYSSSSSDNFNWAPQARRLLKPEEVIALPARAAITFTPGVPPICTWLIRFFEEKSLAGGKDRVKSRLGELVTFAARATWCATLFGFAVCLTLAIAHSREQRSRSLPPPVPHAYDR